MLSPSPIHSDSASPASSPPVHVKVPGFKVLNTLRLNYEYSKLQEPGAMLELRQDLQSWLASVVGMPEYVYAIGEKHTHNADPFYDMTCYGCMGAVACYDCALPASEGLGVMPIDIQQTDRICYHMPLFHVSPLVCACSRGPRV